MVTRTAAVGAAREDADRPLLGRAMAEEGAALPRIERLARDCRACDLYRRATQTVFGAGPVPAPMLLVGEQPGDREDRAGEPFVGPAGRVLGQALEQAGIDRGSVYVTNVVKHFRWRASGKRRLHERPDRAQVAACGPWLEAEILAVRPRVVMLMGATAAQWLLGPSFRVTGAHGRPLPSRLSATVFATIHPSAVLRGPAGEREARLDRLVGDLRAGSAALRDPWGR